MELLIVGIIVGILIGAIAVFRLRPKTVGYLKVTIDEENVPYLFLQLDSDGMDEIYKRSHVILKVDLKSCNPQQ